MAKTQWHPAFCAAMRLELREHQTLQFTNEFNLTEKPLEVDLLIINKPSEVRIENAIGEFFCGHNLLEYKSPSDHRFNEYAMYQALSYAYYYCDRYQTKDVTVSLVVSKGHFDIMKWLEAQGIQYTRRHAGIYTIHGINLMKMQIVVTEEIDSETFCWLSVLTDKLTETKARRFVQTAYGLTENEDRRLADSVMQVLLSANGKVFEQIKEDKDMSSALMKLMKPEVEKYAEEYAEDCIRKTNVKHVKAMIRHGDDNEYIKFIVGMTDEEINELRKDIE